MTSRVLPIKQYLSEWFHSNHSLRFKFNTLHSLDGELLTRPILQSSVNDRLNSDEVQKIVFRLPQVAPFVEQTSVEDTPAGPVIQLCINRRAFIDDTIDKLRGDLDSFPEKCRLNSPKPIKQIVEFSSPNIAKPFHCGHLRSTIIGNVLANLKKYLGNDVIKLNYLGDWGTQFGLLSHGFDCFGSEEELKKSPIKHLFDVYVQANRLDESDDSFRQEAKLKFKSMEKDLDDKEIKKWNLFKQYSMKEYDKIYRQLGIVFDDFHFESMYNKLAHQCVNQLEDLKLIETCPNGAKIILLEKSNSKEDNFSVPLIKNDGSTLYLTRDIAAAIDRKEKYNFDEMYYVVGKEQSDHFNHLRQILFKMGHKWASNLILVSFGRIIGMSTRKGEIIFLEDIINEAKQKCLESTFASKTTKSDHTDIDRLASVLGLTAVYVHDLRTPKSSDYRFDWSKALNLRGQSGISLQYVHARIRSIERFSNVDLDLNVDINYEAIEGSFWDKLLIHLSRFDDVLEETSKKRDPSILVRYLIWLSTFSNGCIPVAKVKGEPKDIAQTRLLIYHCSRKVLQKGLNLIGLEALDQI
ncbi:probable arginine--tRNA ligase, mitochondrial [Tetranychus urticae]|uniref:Probable arginine--tRNA ligase, mitochondrial n=1 Tax=Tetranychus urticae TaxID=32264 RepID=T1JXZ5_TETUR|nr:probable arginine--tRNA ligase, mitochondrial [Tetranychus urticae]